MQIEIHDYMMMYSPYQLHCYVIEDVDRPAGESLEKIENIKNPESTSGEFLVFYKNAKEFFYLLTDSWVDSLFDIDVRFSYVYMDRAYVDDEGECRSSGMSNGMVIFNRQSKDRSVDCFIISMSPLPDHVMKDFFHEDIEYKFVLKREEVGGRAHKDGIPLTSEDHLGIRSNLYTIRSVEK